MNTEKLLYGLLIIHIAGGTIALLTGLGAMLTTKGSKLHRSFGKLYFWSMTAVFVGAVFNAIGHNLDFLLMVAFFSYYMTVRGYRILFQKKLHIGQKVSPADWMITLLSGLFILALIVFGVWALLRGNNMGIVGLAFGIFGSSFLYRDSRNYLHPPTGKMHWWYGHISSMGGSYISAFTAFVVVNIQLMQFQWLLWILPGIIGGMLIGKSIRKYKMTFGDV